MIINYEKLVQNTRELKSQGKDLQERREIIENEYFLKECSRGSLLFGKVGLSLYLLGEVISNNISSMNGNGSNFLPHLLMSSGFILGSLSTTIYVISKHALNLSENGDISYNSRDDSPQERLNPYEEVSRLTDTTINFF